MYLVFDIGRTHTRIAVSGDGENLDKVEIIDTSTDFPQALSSFKQLTTQLSSGQKITAAAVGVRRLNHPTIPLWSGENLKESLEKLLNTTVYLENDAALAGLGEAIYGAGKGKKIVAFLTVSTGIGGARIVDGKIDQNIMGFEPGNQIISQDPIGYLEGLVSGNAIEKRFGKKGEFISDPKIWEEMAKLLAIGLNNTIVHWSPEIVVLGGSVMKSIPLEKVKINLNEVLKIYPQPPEIVKASLGDKAGLLGGLILLKQLTL